MYKIVSKEQFSEKVFRLRVEAPLIAKAYRAGNFVIVRVGEKGERIPLTIAHADTEKGLITLVIQKVGLSSSRLCDLNEGDYITDVVGPLGQATEIENFGTVVCAGGGVCGGEGDIFASQVVLVVENPLANAGDMGDMGSIPGLGKSPGVRKGNPLQYSCLENSTDRGAWGAIVHGVAKK